MKIPVVWLSLHGDTPGRGYWDQGILEDYFSGNLWKTINGFEFEHSLKLPEGDEGCVVVLPARSHIKDVSAINRLLNPYKWVLLLLTGDEENVFDFKKIKHPNIKIYVMSPREDLDTKKYSVLGTGYPTHMKEYMLDNPPNKHLDWFFAGQVTHNRRKLCANKLVYMIGRGQDNGFLIETEGFTQGVEKETYYKHMMESKTAPCPSGPETPDTFRLFEALESATIPIADTRTNKGDFSDNYWQFFFGEEPPFPILTDYEFLPGYVDDQVKMFPSRNNDVFAWWIRWKRKFAYQLDDDIKKLSGYVVDNETTSDDNITVIIPCSPIKSHPDTKIIDETIESIRQHLPNSEIILTFDGVREEQEDKKPKYNEFIRRILWKCNRVYKNVVPYIFTEHSHQTGMMREIIDDIKTKVIMYVEQDTPLVRDYEFDFTNHIITLKNGYLDVIRFHHEAAIPKEHRTMMISDVEYGGEKYMRTSQWSQRPHLSTVGFYRRILKTCFTPEARSFIEDKMHSVCAEAYILDGVTGWMNYRIGIWLPESKNIKRSYHTDGRAGEAKYDDTQIF